jgi:hypothetical protein
MLAPGQYVAKVVKILLTKLGNAAASPHAGGGEGERVFQQKTLQQSGASDGGTGRFCERRILS